MSDIKYNRIDEDLQQKIISNRESHWINPYAAMIDENEDPSIYQNKVNHYYNNRPPIYKSIDICRHQFMKLVNFKDIDLTNTLLEWARISNELDIAFNIHNGRKSLTAM